MKIEIIKCLQDNYAYLVIDKTNNLAIVIDPSESKPIIDYIEKNKLNLKFILNTHHHFDHVGGNKELKKKYNSKVIGFEKDKNRIPEIDIALCDKEIWKNNNFEESLKELFKFKQDVNSFFDNVKVNDENELIKKNRLELLNLLCKSFDNFFNFSKIEG